MSAESLVGTTIGGRYRLKAVLGAGGMGEVYLAETDAHETVALKVLRAREPEVLARFAREVQLTCCIRSPHVVEILDFGRDQATDCRYLTMPVLEGRDVATLLDQVRPLEPQAAVRIVRQACAGLAAAHAVKVVHRDVKPSNLFLTRGDAPGSIVVRVLDFGIGKRVSTAGDARSLSRSGNVFGTPSYMSPEQLVSTKHVDARTDVFSLAVVLYELLAGDAPWAHLSGVTDILVAISTKDAPPLHERARSIDPELSRVVAHALERDVERRCKTIEEFAELLRPWAGGGDALHEDMLVVARRPDTSEDATVGEKGATRKDAAASAKSTDPLLGHALAGKYPVVRLLGRGGMGAVYEVEAPADVEGGGARRLAAKVVTRGVGEDEGENRRFLREARAATSIDNPHVVKTFELGNDDRLGVPFILMELLQGKDLASLLRERAPLEPATAIRIVRQAAEGLAAAHDKGIVHRDIKPANLFLDTSPDGAVVVKVCDFGIAKPMASGDQTSQDLTRTGGILGSPAYMSPEQAQSAKHVDARSDVFSLSVCLWEALAGVRAWEGLSSLGEIIVAICTKPVRPLAEAAPWVDAALAKVVHKGLARTPAERWSSVREMSEALRPHADGTSLRQEDLRGVDAATRARRVITTSRSEPPSAEQPTIDAVTSGATPTPTSTWPRWAAAGAAVIALAGAAMLMKPRPEPDTRAAATTPLAPLVTAPESKPRPAVVIIEPEGAEVRVDGRAQPVVEGKIELTGAPGDSFEVVVARGDQTTTTRVFVTRDGHAAPARIALPAPTTSAEPAPTATATARPASGAGKPPPRASSTAKPAEPPHAAESSTKVKPKVDDKPE